MVYAAFQYNNQLELITIEKDPLVVKKTIAPEAISRP